MIESNNEKKHLFVEVFTLTHSLTAQVESFFENFYSFYTADEKLCEYEKFFGEKSQNQAG